MLKHVAKASFFISSILFVVNCSKLFRFISICFLNISFLTPSILYKALIPKSPLNLGYSLRFLIIKSCSAFIILNDGLRFKVFDISGFIAALITKVAIVKSFIIFLTFMMSFLSLFASLSKGSLKENGFLSKSLPSLIIFIALIIGAYLYIFITSLNLLRHP